jgi:hypothetical protein
MVFIIENRVRKAFFAAWQGAYSGVKFLSTISAGVWSAHENDREGPIVSPVMAELLTPTKSAGVLGP